MKNFRRFESVYAALTVASENLKFLEKDVPFPSMGKELQNIREETERAKGFLREWLKENFPQKTFDVYHSNQFSFPEFFAMLKKYPELAAENEDSLKKLLYSLRSSNLYTAELKEVPSLSEFL